MVSDAGYLSLVDGFRGRLQGMVECKAGELFYERVEDGICEDCSYD